MAAQPLQVRSLPLAEAQVRDRLGAGLCLRLDSGTEATLQLRLAPSPFDWAPATALACACGPLWLDDAAFVLGRLSACPAIVLPGSADDHWYWPLYNHCLYAPLHALLSPLQVVQAAPATGLDCLLEWRDATGETSVSRLRAPASTLLNLLLHPAWHALEQPAPIADCPVQLPLLLGHCSLSPAQLSDLQPGDVLLASSPLFSPEGQGHLDAGRCRLHLRQLADTALRFTLTDLEDLPMNAPLAPSGVSERFDDLPLALTLRAGSLTLSLGQLRNLAPGSVLTFDGCVPGQASVYHGECPVAHGELVEIEGRLGLQITRLELRP